MMMILPVFVLTEAAAVSSCVTATTRLAGFSTTIPATLQQQ